ncbi:MAG: RNA-dependent RNA polymerase [Ixodes ricinus orinovirus-like virus 1]|uniref:RNA-directed RNA polymerase n=1 Tax=Ixodes ricinus orinovirus-like virus 1 TaxID=2950736 RepID=A0AAE9LUK7_9MONO|nr:MAG: RNA-dependent RNA polymerase [Ixodes ricinus orinovirus-like virus 1]
MDNLDGLDIKRVPTVIFRKDRHLSSALVISEIQYLIAYQDNPKALKKEHMQLLNDLGSRTIIHPQYAYSWFMDNTSSLVRENHSPELNALLTIATRVTEISIEDYTYVKARYPVRATPFLQKIYNIKVEFDNLFDTIVFSPVFRQEWQIGKIKGCAYGNLHLVHLTKSETLIMTHAHVAGIRDMFNSWFDILLYSLLCRNKYKGHDLYTETERIIYLMTSFHKNHLAWAAVLLKSWPSLAIASILRCQENDTRFLNSLARDMQYLTHTELYQWLTRPMSDTPSVHMHLEMSGLWKCFGHPIIDMDSSVKNWLKTGAVMKPNLTQAGYDIYHMFCMVFCKNYFKEKRSWPPLTFTSATSDRVVDGIRSNTWNEDSNYPWLSREFAGVILGECLTFDMHVDVTDLLSDKSIIPCREQWIHEYDKQVHRTLYGFFPSGPSSTTKSAVISYLEKEEVSVKEIIDTIQSRLVPKSWYVTVCVPKEREQKKDKARCFAKMTPEMRLYQTATESNIATGVFPYVPQQTMTMGEEKLTRVISRMTSPVRDKYSQEFRYVVVDFSAWCTNHRHELCEPTFRAFDNLFGLKGVYTFTHLFPLKSVLLFQDRFCPPQQDPLTGDPLPGQRCYYGAEGWQEGLRQKGWTTITIMLINRVAERCNTSATLIGQGDNQVILIRIPPSTYLHTLNLTTETYLDWFVDELVIESERCGLPIKGEETWRSQKLFEYSREYHFESAQVSATLKRISRLASEANQTLPTLTGDLSSLYSTGAAAAGRDHNPMSSFYCTTVEAAYLIRRKFGWLSTMPYQSSVACLLVSRYLGGLPVALYANFCTRAVQDNLSTNLHLIKTALMVPDVKEHIARWVNLAASSSDWEALIKDPQCLPVSIPPNPESLVRQTVKEGLPSIVRNRLIKSLFSHDTDAGKIKLIDTLMRIRPVNPRLLNKLYSLSNLGLQEHYLGKFSNTRSIQKLAFATWADEGELLRWMATVEATASARYKSTSGTSAVLDRVEQASCITVLTYHLRMELWGHHLEGVTMPAQQEQTTLHPYDDIPPAWLPSTILIEVESSLESICPPTKGRHQAYFGAQTKLRARRAPLQILEIGSMLSSIKQLVEMRGWLADSPELITLVDTLIAEKTTVPLSTLEQYTRQVYSGTLSHRLDCPGLRRGGLANSTTNIASHISICSDTATMYSKQGTNYTICFQSVFLYSLSSLAQMAHMGVNIKDRWGAVFSCSSCTSEIPHERFTLGETEYQGTKLPLTINTITPKITSRRVGTSTSRSQDPVFSYSVLMARRFVLWQNKTDHLDHITTMSNRDVDDIHTVTNFNISEFTQVDIKAFMHSLVYYSILFDDRLYYKHYLLWERIPLLSSEKSSYDALLDTITRCGLLKDLSSLIGTYSPPSHRPSHVMLRGLLIECLLKILSDGSSAIIANWSHLTTEDSLAAYRRAICLLLRLHGEVDQPPPLSDDTSITSLRTWLQDTYSEDADLYTPAIVMTEDLCVSYVRENKRARARNDIGEIPLLPFGTLLHDREEMIANPKWALACNPSSYSHRTFLVCNILQMTGPHIDEINTMLTTHDRQGELYAALAHLYKRAKGYPIWSTPDVVSIVDRGPLSCVVDACDIEIDFHPWLKAMCSTKRTLSADLVVGLRGDRSLASLDPTKCKCILLEKEVGDPPVQFDGFHCYILCHALDVDSNRRWHLLERSSQRLVHNRTIFYSIYSLQSALSLSSAIYQSSSPNTCGSLLSWLSSQVSERPTTSAQFTTLLSSCWREELRIFAHKLRTATSTPAAARLEAQVRRIDCQRDARHHLRLGTGWYMIRKMTFERFQHSLSDLVCTWHIHNVEQPYVCLRKTCNRPPVRQYRISWNQTDQAKDTTRWLQVIAICMGLPDGAAPDRSAPTKRSRPRSPAGD